PQPASERPPAQPATTAGPGTNAPVQVAGPSETVTAAPAPAPASVGAPGVADVRRLWPELLVRLREIKRTPWSLISQESAVVDVADGILTLAFRKPSLRDTFARRDDFQDNLRQAITDVLGVDLRVDAIVDPSADPGGSTSSGGESARPSATPQETPPVAADPAAPRALDVDASGRSAGAENGSASSPRRTDPDDDVHPDDPDHHDSALSERQLLERSLGARVIEEIEHG
ncbi:MAG TPA: hypothetical protein VJ644_06835, partial [Jiangellaceae bacterium]|nr:hypothetical protein [Jiangellaceae bacterium]